MKNSYKNFYVGDKVKAKNQPILHQYYNYPKGDNLKVLNLNGIGVIVSIPPKVRITLPNTGEYFFNILFNGEIYTETDYHNLQKVKE